MVKKVKKFNHVCVTYSIINTSIIFLNGHKLFFYLAVLGLCCCARAFSSCSEWGLLSVAVRGLFIAVASLVEELGV